MMVPFNHDWVSSITLNMYYCNPNHELSRNLAKQFFCLTLAISLDVVLLI